MSKNNTHVLNSIGLIFNKNKKVGTGVYVRTSPGVRYVLSNLKLYNKNKHCKYTILFNDDHKKLVLRLYITNEKGSVFKLGKTPVEPLMLQTSPTTTDSIKYVYASFTGSQIHKYLSSKKVEDRDCIKVDASNSRVYSPILS